MASLQSYNYTIEATYYANGKQSTILSESIQSLMTKYDYISKNMPILYMTMKVKTDLYNIMVENLDVGTITVSVYKYSKLENGLTKSSIYIRRNFSYFMPTNVDYSGKIDDGTAGSNSYKVCTLGLYDMDIINRNNISNGNDKIIVDSDMQSIVHHFMSPMKVIMEPFKDQEKIKTCIIPPFDTITKLLEYLNSVHTFYDTGYLFFKDFNRSYLLSKNGNPVGINSNELKTIIIKILDRTDYQTKYQSMEIDTSKSTYVLYIDASFTNIKINHLKDKKYHKIIGIDSIGNRKEIDLDIPKNVNGTEKIKFERVYNGNLDYINIIKDGIENDTIVLNINKTEIDTDLLTPNREFLIQNYDAYKDYNGRYLLAYKRDIMVQQNNSFINNTIIGLKKV